MQLAGGHRDGLQCRGVAGEALPDQVELALFDDAGGAVTSQAVLNCRLALEQLQGFADWFLGILLQT